MAVASVKAKPADSRKILKRCSAKDMFSYLYRLVSRGQVMHVQGGLQEVPCTFLNGKDSRLYLKVPPTAYNQFNIETIV